LSEDIRLNWNEAVRIDWGTILLFGSGIIFDVIGVVLITFGITLMARLVGLA
jgi:hypothetical protein